MPEEKPEVEQSTEGDGKFQINEALAAALKKFQQKFSERSFSQRHTELGKMINCPKCGLRHRQGDPLMKDSTAHGPQSMATHDYPSRAAVTKGKRILPHHSAQLLRLVERTQSIYHKDIEPYFREEGQRLVLRARRMALIQLTREFLKRIRVHKRQQDVSRRINRGLLPGGSR